MPQSWSSSTEAVKTKEASLTLLALEAGWGLSHVPSEGTGHLFAWLSLMPPHENGS